MPTRFLEPLKEVLREDWHPVSKAAWVAWLVFYGLFLLHALSDADGFLVVDHVNLIVHEAGHLLFGWFGATLGLWGGTLLELLAPAALAIYFAWHRQTTGVAFSAFFLFENFLYISTYMADARVQNLPLVTVGDPEAGGHDWFLIFSRLGLLQQDVVVARFVRTMGWLGMLGTLAWLIHRGRRIQRASPTSVHRL